MKWSYGVTTIPQRRAELLPRTLKSLALGGFGKPRLFVDGARLSAEYADLGLECSCRYPAVRAYASWALALWELYVREPGADWYAVFQDDLACVRNLRSYLERTLDYQAKAYWNLYTIRQNEPGPHYHQQTGESIYELATEGYRGWYASNQYGRGALALVYSRAGLTALLKNRWFVEHPQTAGNSTKNIDGVACWASKETGYEERVHFPSLVQHTGVETTSVMNGVQEPAGSFPGEDFDALSLLEGAKV